MYVRSPSINSTCLLAVDIQGTPSLVQPTICAPASTILVSCGRRRRHVSCSLYPVDSTFLGGGDAILLQ